MKLNGVSRIGQISELGYTSVSVVGVLEVSVPRLCGAVRESRARHFVSIARVRITIRVANPDDDARGLCFFFILSVFRLCLYREG